MRSYVNKKGEKIEVSEEHLKKAVEIKIQLQKSNSGKTNWNTHKKMMMDEGFDDAGGTGCESYRCLIKAYQLNEGTLPEVTKYAELVSDVKLESINKALGEMAVQKRDVQNFVREHNKIQRNLIDNSLIARDIGLAFTEHKFDTVPFIIETNKAENSETKAVVCISDIHIGALVSLPNNQYNYQVATDRMIKYAEVIVNAMIDNNVGEVHVVNLGDVVEHVTMRYAQAKDVEFDFSTQIIKASDLIIKFLNTLYTHLNGRGVKISYSGISGNHDRMEADKNKNVFGDTAVTTINYAIENYIKHTESKIEYVQADGKYEHHIVLNGAPLKFVHGDLDNITDKKLIGKWSLLDDISYKAIVSGHIHRLTVEEVGKGKYNVSFGSLMGSNDFSTRLRVASSASQGYILVNKDGDLDIRPVTL